MSQDFFLTWRAELMANFPSLYTTEVQNDSSSEASGEFETLGPHSEHLVAPTRELKNFSKLLPLEKLTREGREKVKSLRPNFRREGLLEQNPNTPVTDTAPIQAQFNTPIQPQPNPKTKEHCQNCFQHYPYPKINTNSKPPKIIPENLLSKSKLIFQYLHKIHNIKTLNFQSLITKPHLKKTL